MLDSVAVLTVLGRSPAVEKLGSRFWAELLAMTSHTGPTGLPVPLKSDMPVMYHGWQNLVQISRSLANILLKDEAPVLTLNIEYTSVNKNSAIIFLSARALVGTMCHRLGAYAKCMCDI
jgi:hypothetical protein